MKVVNQSTEVFICYDLFAKLRIVSLFLIMKGFIWYLGFIEVSQDIRLIFKLLYESNCHMITKF